MNPPPPPSSTAPKPVPTTAVTTAGQARDGPREQRSFLLRRRAVILSMVLVAGGVVFVVAYLFQQQLALYHSMALQGTSIQVESIRQIRQIYSAEVAMRAQDLGLDVVHDYRGRARALPLPATLTMELGEALNRERPGAFVRLYSDYPFPWRAATGGARDRFEAEALRELRRRPDKPFYRFEDFEGRPSLRYAVADRLQASCVGCHNSHADSPKRDWKEGDVRGVLEFIRPLDNEGAAVSQRRASLWWALGLTGLVLGLGLLGLGLAIRGLRRTTDSLEHSQDAVHALNAGLEQRVKERTLELESIQEELEHVFMKSNEELELRVAERTKDLKESQLASLNVMEDAVHSREKAEKALEDLNHAVDGRKKVEAQLLQAQKMEAIGQLAGGIAHDFNNILGAIIGNTELARMAARHDAATSESLDAIMQASRRAADLVKQILAFSRRHELERKPMQLQIVIREALKLLRSTVSSTIEFRTNLANVRTVLADPTQVHQIVMNLCTNAVHAMGDRPGVLKVELAEIEVDASIAQTHAELGPGRYVRLTVADSGCGMDPATLERIFEPFFTTKEPGEGTGLGLSVVHGIMKHHDGGITVCSEPGAGTTFHLYFPVFETAGAETEREHEPVPRGHGERIMFVDDEPTLVDLGRRILGALGYHVSTKASAVEGLAAVREQPGHFDLVITDLNMPVMNGTTFARNLLEIRPELPIILITGYSATLTPEVARGMGFRELLLKPTNIQTLAEAVNRVFHDANPAQP